MILLDMQILVISIMQTVNAMKNSIILGRSKMILAKSIYFLFGNCVLEELYYRTIYAECPFTYVTCYYNSAKNRRKISKDITGKSFKD